jgi:uncharacterized protein
MKVQQLTRISDIAALDWNQLTGLAYPFLRHEFLLALEQSGAVVEHTGWLPRHLLVWEADELLAVMPLYLKLHSRGEYVFDQQWAQAFQQHGVHYYPKWLTAIPFTPCQGARLAIKDGIDTLAVTQLLLDTVQQLAEQQGCSSWHCLFPASQHLEQLRTRGLSIREGVQFQWLNKGYADFEAFLQTLNASKRKMIKRERKRVAEQGVQCLRLAGSDVSAEQWQIFFEFYAMTYLKRGTTPYLNLYFFQQLAATMGEQLLLVLALKDNKPVAAALSLIGDDTLYGRYWGCFEEYHSLHFEVCYYQGLDYCLEQGLQRFDSGAQGEHKIARGFEPISTYSAHWIKDVRFAKAITQFLSREQNIIQAYKQDAASYLPFKRGE